jgi:hypothetical protein
MQPTSTAAAYPVTEPAGRSTAEAPGRAWAVAGAAGAVVGLAGLFWAGSLTTPGADHIGDNAPFVAAIADGASMVWAYQVICSFTAVCVVLFAAGLRRYLAAQEPGDSLVPAVATAGLALVAVMLVAGGGIATELYWALNPVAGAFDPDTVSAQVEIYNTFAWVWGGAGLTAAAVGIGGLRHGSVGKPFAVFSLLCALLVAATQMFPVQYMALLPGALWMLVAGVRFAVRPRSI